MDSTNVETTLEARASRFAALGDPCRLSIIEALRAGTRCVCELRADIPVSPSLLSYHLRVLRDAGLITASRRGRWIDYQLAGDRLAELEPTVAGRASR